LAGSWSSRCNRYICTELICGIVIITRLCNPVVVLCRWILSETRARTLTSKDSESLFFFTTRKLFRHCTYLTDLRRKISSPISTPLSTFWSLRNVKDDCKKELKRYSLR